MCDGYVSGSDPSFDFDSRSDSDRAADFSSAATVATMTMTEAHP
jgi:hypothetical protein